MQIARLDAGLLIVFAFGGMTVIGAMLAGWSSSNKFSLLGALRAGSQMISYELILGLTLLGLIVVFGTIDRDAVTNVPIISPVDGRHAETGLPTANVTGQGGFCRLESHLHH